MNALGAMLLCLFAQGLLLLVPAALVFAVVRKLGPATAARVALVGAVLPVLLAVLAFAPWPLWIRLSPDGPAQRLRAHQISGDATRGAGESPADSATQSDSFPNPAFRNFRPGAGRAGVSASLASLWWSSLRAVQSAAAVNDRWTWLGWGALAALAGAAFYILRFCHALCEERACLHVSRPVTDTGLLDLLKEIQAMLSFGPAIELRQSPDVELAAVIGWRRPVVLLAPDWRHWSQAQRRAVLAHEVAHLSRRDYLVWIVAKFLADWQYFHPLVHWSLARLRFDQELAADALAIAVIGGQKPYYEVIRDSVERLVNRPKHGLAPAFVPSPGTFAARILLLRDQPLRLALPHPAVPLLLASLLLISTLGAAGLRISVAAPLDAAPDVLATGEGAEAAAALPPVPQSQMTLQALALDRVSAAPQVFERPSSGGDDYPNSVAPAAYEYQLACHGSLLIPGSLESDYDHDTFRVRVAQSGPLHVIVIPKTFGSRGSLKVSWATPELGRNDSDEDRGSGRGGRMYISIPRVASEPDNWVNIDLTTALDDNAGKSLGDYLLYICQPGSADDTDPDTIGPESSPILLDPRGNGYVGPNPRAGKRGPRIDFPGDVDVFAVRLPAKGDYTFTVAGTNSGFSPRLRLFDAAGISKSFDASGSAVRVQVSLEGKPGETCFLEITARGNAQTGAYTIQVTRTGGW